MFQSYIKHQATENIVNTSDSDLLSLIYRARVYNKQFCVLSTY